ncbi:hypothetical protein [Actinomadura sediminis]|uniref:Uncharacterized protein n=1 Tax=Actinomadura sediminis TaxID=1038904 RepID=A0ABW3ESN7_9ACTN
MGQPGMRITVDAAMRARDVSRPRPAGEDAPAPARSPKRSRAAKNERRRQDKRGGASPGGRLPAPPADR